MRRFALGLVLALTVAAPPAFSQIALLFPHGIAAGDVTPTSALLWTRVDRRLPLAVEVSTERGFAALAFTTPVVRAPDRGGSIKLTATRLKPGTRYFYRFKVGRGAYSDIGTFLTAPPPEAAADFRLAFSGDVDGTHVNGAPVFPLGLLDAAAASKPDIFLLVGDTIYSDSPHGIRPARSLDEYRAKYKEVQATSPMQALLRATSLIATWDDHEIENDFDSESVDQSKLQAGRQAFLEAWPIAEQEQNRLYRSFRWGRHVEMFILDLRGYRSRQASKLRVCDNPPGSIVPDLAPTAPAPIRAAFAPLSRQMALPVPAGCQAALLDPKRTLLGREQKAWLQQRLRQSPATWKFIVSQVPVQEIFANPYDRWEGYAAERAEILNFIRASAIRNVIWLSTDLHAVLINDVRLATYTPPFEPSGMKEVVVGPIATNTFARAIAGVAGPAMISPFAAFLQTPLPQGLGLSCAVLDRFTFATVEVSSTAGTVTITPQDAAGRPVCRNPLVLPAVR